MNALLIISIILLLLLGGIALLRVRMIIDSKQDRYEIRIVPLARVQLALADETIDYRWKAVLLQGQGQLFPPVGKVEKQKTKNTARVKKHVDSKKRQLAFKDIKALAKDLWRGLKVKRFYFRLNTEDACWNAWLFPAFSVWRANGHDVGIQFAGNSTLILDIEHSVHRIAGAFIHMYLTKTKNK